MEPKLVNVTFPRHQRKNWRRQKRGLKPQVATVLFGSLRHLLQSDVKNCQEDKITKWRIRPHKQPDKMDLGLIPRAYRPMNED